MLKVIVNPESHLLDWKGEMIPARRVGIDVRDEV
jgi:hypothetical protein